MAKSNRNRATAKKEIGGVPIEKLIGFTPQVVRNDYSVKEQRQMYSRLRHVAVARLERLKSSGLPSDLARNYGSTFLKSAFIPDSDLPFMLSELRYFLTAKTSTVEGLREANNKVIKALKESGIEGVNSRNLGEYGLFMEAFRSAHLDRKLYKSDAAATLWDSLQSKNISWRQVMRLGLKTFLDNAYKLDQTELPTGTRRSAANYRKALLEDE